MGSASGISPDFWQFRVGGYQVCDKWLKGRRRHTLSLADIAHYQRIIATLAQTVTVMDGIVALLLPALVNGLIQHRATEPVGA